MAEGGTRSSKSTTAEKDEDDDNDENTMTIICDPCKDEGNNIAVHGYCVDCDDFLCDTCFIYHRRPRPFRHHTLQDSTTMPKTHLNSTEMGHDSVTKCHLHLDKKVISFCETHQQLCCETCIKINHCCCSDILNIDEVVKAEESQQDIQTFKERLVSLNQNLEVNKQKAQAHLNEIDQRYSNALDRVEARLKALKTRDICRVSAIVKKSEVVQKHIAGLLNNTETMEKEGDSAEFYIFRKLTTQQLPLNEMSCEELCNDNTITRYECIDAEDAYGTLCYIKKTPTKIKQLKLQSRQDELIIQSIADIAVLSKDRILVTDRNTRYIMVVDTVNCKTISKVSTHYNPFCISVAHDKTAFVTIPGEHKIMHLTTPDTDVTNYTEFTVGQQCVIVKTDKKLLRVLLFNERSIIMYDRKGKKIWTIISNLRCKDLNNTYLFLKQPLYGDLDLRTKSMYITCFLTNCIVRIEDNGHMKLVVHSDQLDKPKGIKLFRDNTLLVCSSGKRTVLQVAIDTGEIQGFLPEPLPFAPTALAVDLEHNKLYIGGVSKEIHIYAL